VSPSAELHGSDVLELFSRSGDAQGDPYLQYHAERIAVLCGEILKLIDEGQTTRSQPLRILDVGASFQTHAIHHFLGERCSIDTLGFPGDPVALTIPFSGRHVGIDLSLLTETDQGDGDYDIVVLAEVIEHLFGSPRRALRYLRSHLIFGGNIVVQTPNAAALPKRMMLLRGKNPFEEIREDTSNPGHFREYTMKEISSMLETSGFEVSRAIYGEYWEHSILAQAKRDGLNSWLKRRAEFTVASLRPALRGGLTIVGRAS